MRQALRASVAASMLLLGAGAAGPSPTHVAYFLINGFDYREVTQQVFESERKACYRIDVRDYDDGTREYHCYL